MSNRTIVACPNCQAKLDIRSERLGSDLECKGCHQKFIATAPPADEAKVDVECPGCHRTLKVRSKYLGIKVVCTHCEHGFLAQSATGDEATPAQAEGTEDLRRSVDDLERELRAFDLKSGSMVERLEKIELHSEQSIARVSVLERGILAAGQQQLDHASLAGDLAAIRSEFVEARKQAEAGWEARRRDLLAEILARLDEDRDGSRLGHEARGAELEDLRTRNAELERRLLEADARAQGLESRLDPVEESARAGVERADRLETRLGEVEAAGTAQAAIRDEIDRLRGEVQALGEGFAGRLEDFQAGLAAVRSDQASAGAALTEHHERHRGLESGLARFEALQLEGAIDRLAAVESALRAEQVANGTILADLEGRQDRLESDQARWEDLRLEEAVECLAAIESENAKLREAWESLRLEQDRMKEEATRQAERSRAELARLLADREARPTEASPEPSVEARFAPPAPVIRSFADMDRSDLDLMAEDLILSRLVSPGDRPEGNGSIPLVASKPPGINLTTSLSDSEFARQGEDYARQMGEGRYGEAVATARSVVHFTQGQTGDLSLKHALWLRNLGVALLKQGQQAEALDAFHRALEVCQSKAHPNRSPHAICLLDLADAYFLGGDRHQATSFCQTAMEVLDSVGGADHPLARRARACLRRIEASEPSHSPTETVSMMI